ncbi:ABC transporter substrate-binding protein [Paenibacillus sp. GCM10012306]|uniref:ABC transporter substrate-binding protein n=1 Tax=Paenibacillus sp. GCM10012306 TaxID=3317342 RepID=UPI0036168E50
MRIRKNYWLLFAILLLSLTSLSPSMQVNTGNGSLEVNRRQNPSAFPNSSKVGTVDSLHITVALSPAEFTELKALSSSYSLSSGVKIDLKNIETANAEEVLLKDLTVGDSPDIIMTDGRKILDLAKHGYLLPIDIYRSVPGSAPLTRLIPQMQWNGYDWGVPLDIDPYVLVYSPQRLAELGMPSLPRNMNEWNLMLENLRKEPGKYLLALDTRTPYGFAAVLESMGTSMISVKPETLNWMQEALGNFYLSNEPDPKIWGGIQDGNIAIAAVPFSEWQRYGNASLKAEGLLGVHSTGGIESIYSRSFALPAQSEHPEEAVKWLAFITGTASQLDWLNATGGLPALDEIYRSGSPSGVTLPFDSQLLLAEEAAPDDEPEGGWKTMSEAVSLFLKGKLNAAELQKQLQTSE